MLALLWAVPTLLIMRKHRWRLNERGAQEAPVRGNKPSSRVFHGLGQVSFYFQRPMEYSEDIDSFPLGDEVGDSVMSIELDANLSFGFGDRYL